MSKLIRYLLIMLVISFCYYCSSNTSPRNETLKIEFKLIDADSFHFMDPSKSPAYPKKDGRFLEKIKKYPIKLKLLATYQFDAQRNKKSSKLFFNDSTFRKNRIKNFGQNEIEFLSKLSNAPSFDCIISACEVENESGEIFFIFDTNNDEDLSNDSLITYKDFDVSFIEHEKVLDDKNSSVKIAESHVAIEYFDGEKINRKKLLIAFCKKDYGDNKICFLSNRRIRGGYAVFNGQKYFTLILNKPPGVNYTRYDFIWFDLNQNKKYCIDSDFYQQMFAPFTIFGSTYKVSYIDVSGEYIELEKLDASQYPPIEVGLPAPDFEIALNDSAFFKLTNAKGKYVLLDFWMCNPFYCNSISLELYNKYKDKKNLQIFSCALNSFSFKSFRQTQVKDKNDNRIFVSGDEIEKLRKLYHVGWENKLILIDPEFKIKLIEIFAHSKTEKILSEIL